MMVKWMPPHPYDSVSELSMICNPGRRRQGRRWVGTRAEKWCDDNANEGYVLIYDFAHSPTTEGWGAGNLPNSEKPILITKSRVNA